MDLASVGAGFDRPGERSQAVFRTMLDAFSSPGRIVEVAAAAQWPAGMPPAAAAALLALLDPDTRLWIAPRAGAATMAEYLRFHTGCVPSANPRDAHFAYVDDAQALPNLADFAGGTASHPERSATVIVQVDRLEGDDWRLEGPGIEREARIAAAIPKASFLPQWRAQRRRFPCGVDLVLASGRQIVALPRTTSIEEAPCTSR